MIVSKFTRPHTVLTTIRCVDYVSPCHPRLNIVRSTSDVNVESDVRVVLGDMILTTADTRFDARVKYTPVDDDTSDEPDLIVHHVVEPFVRDAIELYTCHHQQLDGSWATSRDPMSNPTPFAVALVCRDVTYEPHDL